jgi:O-succinylbenzoic acid--CoA ligase
VEENGLLGPAEGADTAAGRPDIRTWKVKVGRAPLDADLQRLRTLPPDLTLRLDPNQAWSTLDPTSIDLSGLPIEYVEEPAPWPALADWARQHPVAADESSTVDIATLSAAGVGTLVVKPGVHGALGRVLRTAQQAQDVGMTVVVSSSLEGPIGRAHLEALVHKLPEPRSPAGLARDALAGRRATQIHPSWHVQVDPLCRAAARFGDAVAIETDGPHTFAQWHAAADALAAELGDRTGERLAVRIEGFEGAVRLFAVLRAGGIAALVPPGVQEAAAIEQVGATEAGPGAGRPPGIRVVGPATILWSSGSRGVPKAVVHGLGQHLASAAASHLHTPFERGDRWLASLRMHHVGGLALLFRALHAGGTVVFDDANRFRTARPTHISWVPTQLRRADGPPPPTLKHLLLGGAAAPPELVRERRAQGWPVRTTYGSTELASQVCTSTVDAPADGSGTVLAGRVVRAVPEIQVRGTTMALGKWVQGRVVPLTDEEGWFSTGDVGSVSPDGLRVEGRADTMFISGGENVFPEAIERELGAHPAVRAVVVVDVPDAEWGARPWAFVDGDLTLDAARAWLTACLPRHAWVDRILPWDPRGVGATGKPRRAWFKKQALALARED